MYFTHVGKCALNGLETKNPYYSDGTGKKSGQHWHRFNISVEAQKNNRAFCELMGSVQNVVKTRDSDNNNVEFDWDNRLDEDIINNLASYRQYVAKIGDDRKVFATSYDLVDYLKENSDELNGKTVMVSGQIRKNVYNGKITNRFEFNRVYVVDDDTKPGLKVNGEVFFSKDDIDTSDWKSEKKLYINAYTSEYVSKDEGNKYFPQQIVFDCSKIDWENEKHISLVKFKLKMIGCELDDNNNVKVTLKKGYYSTNVVCNYVNGAELKEFTIDMLTPVQKEQVELGLKEVEDFRPRGEVYGDRVTLFKLVDFNLTGKFEDGLVECDDSVSEFEDRIYVAPTSNETAEDVLDNDDKSSDNNEDDDDLFS